MTILEYLSHIFVSVVVIFLCSVQGKGPKWPNLYNVKGVIEVPYAEITEPIEIWYDSTTTFSSRIDYYNGTVKTYQLSRAGQYGTTYKVEPVINDMVCFKTEGSLYERVTLSTLLPDMDSYQFVGKETVNGVIAEKWQYSDELGALDTMYLQWKDDSNRLGSQTVVPIRKETRGSNHVFIDFTEFSTAEIPHEIFEVEKEVDCKSKLILGSEEERAMFFDPLLDYISHDTRHMDETWNSFKRQFNKNYTNDEEVTRKNLFRQKMRHVAARNRENRSYTLAINHLADLTPEETRAHTSCKKTVGYRSAVFHQPEEDLFDYEDEQFGPLPKRWDWRDRGAVTPIRDQSMCGSCWSFGSTAAIEGAYFLRTGKLVRFSEQALVDCSWNFGNNACDGGQEAGAFQWVMENGMPTDNAYGSYMAQDNFCHINKTENRIKIKGYKRVKPECIECMKRALVQSGPITAGISVSNDLILYQNGVFNDPECKLLGIGHAVVIVGYDSMDGQDYWIVKNSWSIYWGMNGYVLMAMNNNTCSITEDVLVVKA